MNHLLQSELAAFLSVLIIDLTLTIDNAIVLASVAAQVPVALRSKALTIGIAGAALFRIMLAGVALQLLKVVGLMLAGGLLLIWVAWKLYGEISGSETKKKGQLKPKTLKQAALQILIADFSMSLDNTLAVAGAARHHFWIMVVGLSFSIVLMGFAAHVMTHFIQKYRWLSYLGLVVVTGVALSMIWEGTHAVFNAL